MQPVLRVLAGVVVFVRRGCGKIRRAIFVICDIESRLRWYMVDSGVFSDF